jgi:hypothetical protein
MGKKIWVGSGDVKGAKGAKIGQKVHKNSKKRTKHFFA